MPQTIHNKIHILVTTQVDAPSASRQLSSTLKIINSQKSTNIYYITLKIIITDSLTDELLHDINESMKNLRYKVELIVISPRIDTKRPYQGQQTNDSKQSNIEARYRQVLLAILDNAKLLTITFFVSNTYYSYKKRIDRLFRVFLMGTNKRRKQSSVYRFTQSPIYHNVLISLIYSYLKSPEKIAPDEKVEEKKAVGVKKIRSQNFQEIINSIMHTWGLPDPYERNYVNFSSQITYKKINPEEITGPLPSEIYNSASTVLATHVYFEKKYCMFNKKRIVPLARVLIEKLIISKYKTGINFTSEIHDLLWILKRLNTICPFDKATKNALRELIDKALTIYCRSENPFMEDLEAQGQKLINLINRIQRKQKKIRNSTWQEIKNQAGIFARNFRKSVSEHSYLAHGEDSKSTAHNSTSKSRTTSKEKLIKHNFSEEPRESRATSAVNNRTSTVFEHTINKETYLFCYATQDFIKKYLTVQGNVNLNNTTHIVKGKDQVIPIMIALLNSIRQLEQQDNESFLSITSNWIDSLEKKSKKGLILPTVLEEAKKFANELTHIRKNYKEISNKQPTFSEPIGMLSSLEKSLSHFTLPTQSTNKLNSAANKSKQCKQPINLMLSYTSSTRDGLGPVSIEVVKTKTASNRSKPSKSRSPTINIIEDKEATHCNPNTISYNYFSQHNLRITHTGSRKKAHPTLKCCTIL